MRTFSFRDLLRIPVLSKHNEVYLLHPVMDRTMFNILSQLGFDMARPIQYVPTKHRDLGKKVAVGFQAVGYVTQDRAFLKSPLCTIEERLIAASYVDMSLARELATLMGSSSAFNSMPTGDTEDPDFPPELIEPDYEDVKRQILSLEKIRDQIRPNQYNEYGALKSPLDLLEEYDRA
jgi:hypothetical protein